jgi:hypothetical protein
VSTQVINDDGSEADIIEHLGIMHQKGTKGFTEDYLARLHKTLHQRRRDPLPEHTHPGDEHQDPDSDSAGEFAGV